MSSAPSTMAGLEKSTLTMAITSGMPLRLTARRPPPDLTVMLAVVVPHALSLSPLAGLQACGDGWTSSAVSCGAPAMPGAITALLLRLLQRSPGLHDSKADYG